MPWTLYKLITVEILRVFGLALLVIVGALSFAFAIPAVTDGLLGPLQLILLLMYTMPLMLPYAVPVAIAFAVTINFFRMVNDNEITACSALGISYRQLLTPVAVIGLVLLVFMFLLSHWVIPYFSQQVTALIKQDVATFITKKLEKRQAVKMGKWVIYADGASDNHSLPQANEAGFRPYQRFTLHGVALSQIDEQERTNDYTADHVLIDLYNIDGETYASMVLRGVIGFDEDNGLINIGRANLNQVKLPTLFRKKIEFFSLTEMAKIKENPDPYPAVSEAKEKLIRAYAVRENSRLVYERLNQEHFPEGLKLETLNGDVFEILAPKRGYTYFKEENRFELYGIGNDPVRILEKREGKPLYFYNAEKVTLELEESALTLDPNILVTLHRTHIYTPDDEGQPLQQINQRSEMPLGRMYLPDQLAEEMNETNPIHLVESMKADVEQIPGLSGMYRLLIHEINSVMRRIFHQIHARSAMSFMCLFAALLAAIMSMHLRHSPPLATFFWCFLPTIGGIIMISGSRNVIAVADMPAWINTIIIWGGAIMMAIVVGLVYNGLRKN